jgi:Leucine-rich repeat (LRR) protein
MSLALASAVWAQTVQIPDANLKQAILGALNMPGARQVTQMDMLRLTSLNASGKGITDLSGLESAKNLQELWATDNQITGLTPLAGLTKLRKLGLWNNKIQDVSSLAHFRELAFLQLDRNQIQDIGPVANLTKLTELGLNANQVTDIRALRTLTQLTVLSLGGNRIGDISTLANMTKMEHLDLAGCGISDISIVARMPKLNWLHVWDNQIRDISSLRNLTNLTWLGVGNNHYIQDIGALSNLNKLTFLAMEINQIVDVTVLAGLTRLETLRLGHNKITNIRALSDLRSLKELQLQNNEIGDLSPLTGLRTVQTLDVRGNPLLPSAEGAIAQIRVNNPGITLLFDPIPPQPAGTGPSSAPQSDPNLAGWWRLDEGAGTTAFDSSNYRNNGTLMNGPVWVTGRFGKAVQFDGANDYVQVPHHASLCVSSEVTVMAWINTRRWETPGQTWQGILAKGSGPRSYSFYTMVSGASGVLHFSTSSAVPNTVFGSTSTTTVPLNQWVHVCAMVKSGRHRYYINGMDAGTGGNGVVLPGTADTQPVRIGITGEGFTRSFQGLIDEVRIYNRALSAQEVQAIVAGSDLIEDSATVPSPADGATDVPRDASLAWNAGRHAGTHDVYWGSVLANIENGSRTGRRGALVSQGQAETTFDPPGVFAYGQTYYWRIDEVRMPPDNTLIRGNIWSFTVEPYGYLVPPVGATASSSQRTMGPENTINGSGLSGDQHGTEPATMWLSRGVPPNWIQYEFDKVYTFTELKVWNSNQSTERSAGYGVRKVTIEYSTDGTTWKALANIPELAQAPGLASYTANTTVNLNGISARFVKLTIHTNWSGVAAQTGLSEVQFAALPLQARAPQPATGATGVPVDAHLDWRPGREATWHKVYLGTDPTVVAEGTVAVETVADHGFAPGALDLGTTYYWRVDELNNAASVPGEVWSFTTQPYAVVDDFESYTDRAGNEIFSTWIGGPTDSSGGSIVAPIDPGDGIYCETTIVHGDSQALRLAYHTAVRQLYFEAARMFDEPQDWTAGGIQSLSLWFRGAVGNSGQLYVKIGDAKVAYDGPADDLAKAVWIPWNIDLSKVAGNLSQVTSLTIGVEGSATQGTLYVDDIRLYPTAPTYLTPVDPGRTNLVARWTLDGNGNDSSGRGHHGTVHGTAQWVPGRINQALQFNGPGTYVDCGKGASLNLTGAVTITAWIRTDVTDAGHKIAGNQDGTTGGYKMGIYNNLVEFEIRTAANVAALNRASPGGTVLQPGLWYHVAGVYSEGQFIRTYVFGRLDRELLAPPVLGSSTGTFKLGREPFAASAFWLGALDDVRVYNQALSQEEILWVMGQATPAARPF